MPLLGATGGGSAKGFGALANLGYFIRNSLRLRRANNAYLSRTPASAGNQKTWTYSAWVKRGLLGSIQDIWHANGSGTSENDYFAFDSDTLQFRIKNSNVVVCELITTQVFRDPSAWYHIIVAWDSTQATSSNRVKIYVNGTQITAFSTSTYPSQNTDTSSYNNTVLHTIGTQWYNSTLSNYYDGYITEINFIDGQALTPSSFGKTDAATGQWIPKKYAGTYGTNGFYLKFADASAATAAAIGKDSSGNGNNWTPNNISVTAGATYDAMTDSPTLTSATVANYCVLNPLNKDTSITVTNANLSASAGGTNIGVTGSIAISSGKWYWEVTQTAGGVATSNIVGITDATLSAKTAGLTTNSYGYGTGSTAYKWNAGTNTAYGVNWTNGDVIGVAFDADAGSLTFYKNGSSQGTAFTGISGTFYPAFGFQNTSAYDINFGQRPFSYTPPTGFKSLNTFNLP